MLRLLFVLLIVLPSISVYSQETADDIIQLIEENRLNDINERLNSFYQREKKNDQDSILIHDLHRIVKAFKSNNNYYSAIQWLYFIKDSICSDKIGLNDKIGECINIRREIGEFYSRIGDYQSVINCHLENLQILENFKKDSPAYNSTIQSIGYNHYLLKDYDSSEYYLTKSLELALKYNLPDFIIVNSYNSLGYFYFNTGNYSKSESNYFEGLKILNNQKEKTKKVESQEAMINGNLGGLYLKLGKETEAILLLTKDYQTNFKNKNDGLAINAVIAIATYYRDLDKYNEEIEVLNKALDLTNLNKDNQQLLPIYELLFNAYFNNDDKNLTRKYYNFYDSLNNEVLQKDEAIKLEIEKGLLRNILESQVRYQENMARVQAERNEVLEEKNFYYALRFWILGGIVIFVLVGGFYTVKRRLKFLKVKKELAEKDLEMEKLENEKINLEIKYKNKDLTNFAIDLSRKQEVLQRVKEDLDEMKKKHWDREELNGKIIELTHYASNNMIVDNQLQEFQTNIETVNAKFFDALKQKYPALTELDAQICALIRLGLSNKEIATMRNVSYKAIRMSRYRIRKKLDIEADEDMVEFLKAF